ncbi:DNA polymerase III subunit gamma/tau [Thalassotalea piscium]|uniref:DNA polymerase III subunit gamma/tau n=1 Tax=Thalassotalea piscium TaxID=1230533 RepID=A0A7X0NJJ0_9GAMM|nr:DNA polymerase III subunit gamma/tau [Thalassotalea piscium]MBB6544476.1 DNA polymerase-3 subunit gamma/tau [Thalassotalea piscium]
MSYQVLARKWRPRNFQELMGQEHVVTVLSNALSQNRLHHAYLFTGTRGVGKTTIARIFAKSLNCLEGVSASPCGKCDICQDIDQGRFVDLLEIDAASRTKVDDTREILDNVQYSPTRGRYKVYLIDEVHMLSRSSFNALLKTLEEPPEHVKFILATTDPQKLPITVLSRCLQFHLKALMVEQINNHLNTILAAEQITYEPAAILLLAKAAKGSIRDSLSLTDQAIAQGQGHITLANVRQMLGGVDDNWVFKILIHLIKNDSQSLMALSQEIATYAPNYSRLLAELIQLLHQVAMYQVINSHFDLPPEQAELLIKFSQAMSPDDVQLYYQIALTGRKDMPYAADERSAFEMVLLRLLAFKPQVEVSQQSATVKPSSEVNFDESALPLTSINQPVEAPVEYQEQSSQQQLTTEMLSIEQAAQDLHVLPYNANSSSLPHKAVELAVPSKTEPLIDDETLPIAPYSDAGDQEQQPNNSLPLDDDSLNSTTEGELNPVSYDIVNQAQSYNSESAASESASDINATDTISTEPENLATAPEALMQSPVQSVLATRNMLRSRKKALENEGKKSDGADERQLASNASNESVKEKPAHVPELEALPEQGFTPEVINPAEIKFANQVDRWANMIDTMELGGRLRVLAGNSTICESSTNDRWVFKLNQSVKHLKSETAHQQLEENLSSLLNQKISIVLELVESTKDDPFQIQSQINDKRLEYAKELISNDEVVKAMKNTFQAIVSEDTIAAR